MAIKPILFNTKMVRAILDGRKTQTRRIVKAKGWKINDIPKWREENVPEYWFTVSNDHQATVIDIRPPYYRGDILWVRETWNGVKTGNPKIGYHTAYWYKADDKGENPDDLTMQKPHWILSAGKHTGCSAQGGNSENDSGVYHAEKWRVNFPAVQFVAGYRRVDRSAP